MPPTIKLYQIDSALKNTWSADVQHLIITSKGSINVNGNGSSALEFRSRSETMGTLTVNGGVRLTTQESSAQAIWLLTNDATLKNNGAATVVSLVQNGSADAPLQGYAISTGSQSGSITLAAGDSRKGFNLNVSAAVSGANDTTAVAVYANELITAHDGTEIGGSYSAIAKSDTGNATANLFQANTLDNLRFKTNTRFTVSATVGKVKESASTANATAFNVNASLSGLVLQSALNVTAGNKSLSTAETAAQAYGVYTNSTVTDMKWSNNWNITATAVKGDARAAGIHADAVIAMKQIGMVRLTVKASSAKGDAIAAGLSSENSTVSMTAGSYRMDLIVSAQGGTSLPNEGDANSATASAIKANGGVIQINTMNVTALGGKGLNANTATASGIAAAGFSLLLTAAGATVTATAQYRDDKKASMPTAAANEAFACGINAALDEGSRLSGKWNIAATSSIDSATAVGMSGNGTLISDNAGFTVKATAGSPLSRPNEQQPSTLAKAVLFQQSMQISDTLGPISVTAQGNNAAAEAIAFNDNNFIENLNGAVTVSAKGNSASAVGIAGTIDHSMSLNNAPNSYSKLSGKWTVSATATQQEALAHGIGSGVFSANKLNMVVTATGKGVAQAYGYGFTPGKELKIFGQLAALTVAATGTSLSEYPDTQLTKAIGIRNDTACSLEHLGPLSVTASGNASAAPMEILAIGIDTTNLSITGSMAKLTVSATAAKGSQADQTEAIGIRATALLSIANLTGGSVRANGVVQAQATGVSGTMNSTLGGNWQIDAAATGGMATAYGLSGNFETIDGTVKVSATGDIAEAVGYSRNSAGQETINGTVTATANGKSSASAYGISNADGVTINGVVAVSAASSLRANFSIDAAALEGAGFNCKINGAIYAGFGNAVGIASQLAGLLKSGASAAGLLGSSTPSENAAYYALRSYGNATDDTVTFGANSISVGDIDLGTGDDTLHLNSTSQIVGDISNVEKLDFTIDQEATRNPTWFARTSIDGLAQMELSATTAPTQFGTYLLARGQFSGNASDISILLDNSVRITANDGLIYRLENGTCAKLSLVKSAKYATLQLELLYREDADVEYGSVSGTGNMSLELPTGNVAAAGGSPLNFEEDFRLYGVGAADSVAGAATELFGESSADDPLKRGLLVG